MLTGKRRLQSWLLPLLCRQVRCTLPLLAEHDTAYLQQMWSGCRHQGLIMCCHLPLACTSSTVAACLALILVHAMQRMSLAQQGRTTQPRLELPRSMQTIPFTRQCSLPQNHVHRGPPLPHYLHTMCWQHAPQHLCMLLLSAQLAQLHNEEPQHACPVCSPVRCSAHVTLADACPCTLVGSFLHLLRLLIRPQRSMLCSAFVCSTTA